MKLDNDMKIEIRKSWYNKTKVQEDGVTHIVDPEQHTVYQFGMAKNYFDIDNRPEVIKCIISDLQSTIKKLQQMLEQDRQKDNEEFRR